MLSLVHRARNKPHLLSTLKSSLLSTTAKLPSLQIVHRLFYKLNAVYKQASIERQAVKRRDIKERPLPHMFESCPLMHGPEIEVLVMQLIRTGRLKASTTLSGTTLNGMLMEYTPSNRVLSGGVIVF